MNRKIIVGGAWPYANNSLHLGHLAALISGDVLARYHRLQNDHVIYVSGTDCHGTPITLRAKKENVTPKEICNKYHEEFKEVFSKMSFSYDLYTKTEDEYHKEKVMELFRKIYDNGYIIPKKDQDNFCEKCNKFVADRELILTCPNCKNETKGDQCDCGYVPTKEDLKEAICTECGSVTITKENNNLYLDLPKLQSLIKNYLEENENNWRKNARNESNKYMNEGLKQRAVTRNLSWGVDIPVKGFEDKKMYVWIDAVLGYLTATMKYADENNLKWEDWWKNENSKIYMVHGKDNIVFHSLILPGLLIALEDSIHLPDMMVSTEYLNFNEQKFSKSKGIGLTILEAIEKYDTETLRFHLIKNGPENKDANFTEEEYILTHNEITNKLGNFVNRTLKYKGLKEIPKGIMDKKIEENLKNKYNEIGEFIENIEFRKATNSIVEILEIANKYYDEEKPWIKYKEDLNDFNNVIYTCSLIIANISNLIYPFMPKTADRIKEYLNIKDSKWEYIEKVGNIKLDGIEPLFERK